MKCITETEYTLHLVSNDLLLLYSSPCVLYRIAFDRYGKKKLTPSIWSVASVGEKQTNTHVCMFLTDSLLSYHWGGTANIFLKNSLKHFPYVIIIFS